jgi:hypothetical protein
VSGRKIKQQIYTRERGGIFHPTAGYDTIAISEDLDKAFVKKYLHPICIYTPPKALSSCGEKDGSLYPEALTIIQPETGDLIIGQAVHIPRDFTGQRSTYFMHNYIIPQECKQEWLKNPARLFQLNDFITSYDRDMGQVLPESEISVGEEKDLLANNNELLLELGISEQIFKQLLFAAMSSVSGKKMVYIALNAELQDYSKVARKLLELLFHYLPYSYRGKLGALTFSSEPEGKKGINITFFEPGTLNIRNRLMEKQFIFDLSTGRISGVATLEGQDHEYLDFAWMQLVAGEKLDDFYEFAERALTGFTEENKLEIASYYELTAIYQTLSEGDTSYFEKNKTGFLFSLLKFLQKDRAVKKDLEQLFIAFIQEEKWAADEETATDFVRAVLEFNQISPNEDSLSFIINTLKHYKNTSLFQAIWKILEDDTHTYQTLVELVHEHPDHEELFKKYIDEKFKPLRHVEDILPSLSQLIVSSPFLLKNSWFESQMIFNVADAVGDAINPFKAAKLVREYHVEGSEFTSFKERMLVFTEIALLDGVSFNNLTLEDIETFGRLTTKQLSQSELKEAGVLDKYKIMTVLYDIFSNPTLPVELSLKSLPFSSRKELHEILKHLLQGELSPTYFQHLLVAFADEDGRYHYSQLFGYLRKNADEQTALLFIQWTAKKVGTDIHYQRELKIYLQSPNSIWHNKVVRKELLKVQSYSFKKLIKEIQHETASPVVKFFKRHTKP